MRVILGYLLQEATDYRFSCDDFLNDRWISEIREYVPSEQLRSDVLYVASEDDMFSGADLLPGSVPVIMPELPAASIPRAFAPIVPEGNADYRTVIQKLRDEFRRLDSLNLALYQTACCGSGLDELLNIVGSHTPNHLYVADMSFKVLAYTNRPYMNEMSATWRYQVLHGYLPVHVMKGLIDNGEFETLNGYHNSAVHYSKSFYVPFVTRNVFYKNRPQAHIFIVNIITRPCYKDIVLGQILGDFLEQNIHILSQYRPERINNNFEDFFNDVLTGGCVDEDLIQDQINLIGWDINSPFGLAIMDMEGRDEGLQRTVMYEIESKTKWMCFHHGKDLVVAAELGTPHDGRNRALLEELAGRYSIQVFTAVPFKDLRNIGKQYDFLNTIRDLYARVHSEKQYNCVYALEMAPYYYIESLRNNDVTRSLCSPDAKLLLEYDRENETELFRTYLVYLLNDRNLVKSAKELNVHRNTLVYRIDKIHEMISTDDEDNMQKMHLLASMLILQYDAKY